MLPNYRYNKPLIIRSIQWSILSLYTLSK